MELDARERGKKFPELGLLMNVLRKKLKPKR